MGDREGLLETIRKLNGQSSFWCQQSRVETLTRSGTSYMISYMIVQSGSDLLPLMQMRVVYLVLREASTVPSSVDESHTALCTCFNSGGNKGTNMV